MKTKINLFGCCCIVVVLLIGLIGCGEDAIEEDLVAFVQAIPAANSEIQPDAEIIVSFDGTPSGVNVDGAKFSVSGANVTITGPFTAGTLELTITWSDGVQALTYTVKAEGTTEAPPPAGMVLIDAGEFRMGSNQHDWEKPIHSVYVDAFYMDKYEVTNAEYAEFLNAKDKHTDASIAWLLIGSDACRIEYVSRVYRPKAGYDNHPVVLVSWYGAMAYAAWAGKRLPTEAEWEKAARGGLSDLKYPWGNSIDSTNANYNRHIGGTTAVGKYPANGYGLYDLSGNVWEWCLDEYNAGFYAISPARNPLSGANSIQWMLDNYTGVNSNRVMRGGHYTADAQVVRVATRNHTQPRVMNGGIGFRCVKSVTP